MKLAIVAAFLFCQAALSDTFSYQLYFANRYSEKLDIKIELSLSGKFDKSSKITGLKIFGSDRNRSILLFQILAEALKASWNKNVLNIESVKHFRPLVKEYTPIQSDTGIKKGEDYGLFMKVTEIGTPASDLNGMFLANQTVQEMGLNGFLKLVK